MSPVDYHDTDQPDQEDDRYAVGDLDPTPVALCFDERDGYKCTWPAGHDHPQHVAGDGDEVCAVWDAAATDQPDLTDQEEA